jgi:iron complex outermembrane receptor protein
VVNAPATVTVISEQTIRHLPSQNVAELLRAVPGMNVVRTSAREFNVTSRGGGGVMPSAQLALIDGRSIYLDCYGLIAWDGLPMNLDEIKQVDVIRGPASAVWGANAMNGVINIITKPPREMLGTTLALGIGTFDRSGGGAGGKYLAMLKISNLANTPVQNHLFGDILKRQLTGEFRVRF